MLYTLNLYSIVYQLYFNKTGGKSYIIMLDNDLFFHKE